jgi:hypothetical protein
MARTQQAMTLTLERATVQRLYADVPVRRSSAGRRERRIPLSPEVLDLLPAQARRVIRAALARGGVEAFLVRDGDEHDLTIVIRNKRRYA